MVSAMVFGGGGGTRSCRSRSGLRGLGVVNLAGDHDAARGAGGTVGVGDGDGGAGWFGAAVDDGGEGWITARGRGTAVCGEDLPGSAEPSTLSAPKAKKP